jgi:hypothetical protein
MIYSDPPSGEEHFARIAKLCVFVPLVWGALAVFSIAQEAGTPAAPAAPAANSQGYIEDAPNESLKNLYASTIKPIIQKGSFATPAEKQTFDDYFENYEFKRWTQKKNFPSLNTMRKELRNNCIRARSGQVHDRLNELVLEVLGKKLKTPKYYPAVLVNAMLAIGDLNATEGSPSTPLPQALPVMLDALDDAQQLDVVKIAALVGIKRHVVLGVKNPKIEAAALKLAAIEGSDVGKNWMRKQAVELLGYLQSPGQGNAVVVLLQKIIADKTATLKLRFIAAEALGQINLSNAAGLNANQLIADLVQLMKDGCDAELKDAKEKNLAVSRRNMRYYLGAVGAGLGDANKGVRSLKDSAADRKIAELQKYFTKELLPVLDNQDATVDETQKDADIKKAVEEAPKKLG